jgi:CYTH domain-containing protein
MALSEAVWLTLLRALGLSILLAGKLGVLFVPPITKPAISPVEHKEELRLPTDEIERKWVVAEVPDLSTARRQEMLQGYVAIFEDGSEVRVRKIGDSFWQTLKSDGGLTRRETETPITSTQFDALWPCTVGHRVEKVRYEISLPDDVTAHLDVYNGSLWGLVVVEVEFCSAVEAEKFAPPSWFGREVTWDSRYKNKNLATRGLPIE